VKAQGYRVRTNILYQDSMSSMRLEKHGMGSSSKRTRHIMLRYYFVKEHVDNRTIDIVHCPADQMWADYFTKPLQGSHFYKLRDLIMSIDSNSKYHSSPRSVLRLTNLRNESFESDEPDEPVTSLQLLDLDEVDEIIDESSQWSTEVC
jgi:hypothetical protein